MHGGFGDGLGEHGLMKADGRISVKVYSRAAKPQTPPARARHGPAAPARRPAGGASIVTLPAADGFG